MPGELGSLADFPHFSSKAPVRFFGLELAGAKNLKTSLAALEYFPQEGKIFLIDLFEKIQPVADESNDASLVMLLNELFETSVQENQHNFDLRPRLGVNVSLQLPPCLTCTLKECNKKIPGKCAKPEVQWAQRFLDQQIQKKSCNRNDFTGYTQRPVEIYIKHEILSKLDAELQFDIDETMGGNRGPLTARMQYLKKYLNQFEIFEIWPKLLVAQLTARYGIDRRYYRLYRDLEEGAAARTLLLEALMQNTEIFVYERDQRKITQNLAAFDAFLCAYGALLAYLKDSVAPPKGFPLESGWVTFPPVTDFVPRSHKSPPVLEK